MMNLDGKQCEVKMMKKFKKLQKEFFGYMINRIVGLEKRMDTLEGLADQRWKISSDKYPESIREELDIVKIQNMGFVSRIARLEKEFEKKKTTGYKTSQMVSELHEKIVPKRGRPKKSK
jgi:hypothetical protein